VRSARGARRFGFTAVLRLLVLAATLAVPAGAAPAPRDPEPDDEGPGPLPWRVPGRVGFTVDAATFPDSAGHTLEVYTRVPPGTLARLVRDQAGAARLKLSMRLTNRFGARPQEKGQEIEIVPADTVPGFGKVVITRFPARPGVNRLRVRLEDMLAQKRGLFYAGRKALTGRKTTESETVEGEVTVPGPQAGRDLSDLEFLWVRRESGAASAFRRGEHVAIPNPERLYGLLANEVRAEFAARSLAGDARPWHWHARVLNARGEVVAEQESTSTAARELAGSVAIDLSTHPAGGYDLEVKAWQEGDKGALLRTARFSIAWLESSWMVEPSHIDDAVHFLLTADDETRFARLQVGERERYLEDFWRQRDPTPDTADNEARNAFLSRIDYANKNFDGPASARGMFSDMGRVFIRYGEPDEVLKQVIPAGDETLERVLQDLELSEDRPTGDVHQKGLGGDTRPYEVWVYQGHLGATPDVDPKVASRITTRRKMVFLFVDEHGYGYYTLRFSTE
jgi:GWxTD domain-containing protein